MMESGVPITMNVEPSGCNNNNGGFGGDWGAWIILFLIFGMFGWDGYSRDMEDYSRDGGYGGGNSRDRGYSRDNYDNGNSYRRGRNQRTGEYMHRPNYSRLSGDDTDMDRYKEDKRQYSNSRDGGDKERMLDSLERLVVNVCDMVVQIDRDCDCVDERDIIFKHVKNLYDKLRR